MPAGRGRDSGWGDPCRGWGREEAQDLGFGPAGVEDRLLWVLRRGTKSRSLLGWGLWPECLPDHPTLMSICTQGCATRLHAAV